ncbi:hypothetical protein Lal_00035970 [Lupinus albus]|nr:hypothetical protein Lal_00035970 [Lupinus albus]
MQTSTGGRRRSRLDIGSQCSCIGNTAVTTSFFVTFTVNSPFLATIFGVVIFEVVVTLIGLIIHQLGSGKLKDMHTPKVKYNHDHWFGSSTLFSRYKRLYNLSNQHNDNICNFGSWVVLSKDKPGYWEWRHEKSKKYSVKSAYKLLCSSVQHSSLISQHSFSLWKSKAPPKVITFVWRLFQDRIPTKDSLIRRDISLLNDGGNLCSFCNDHLEFTHHLFYTCTFTYHIWQSMYKWLGFSSALSLTPFHHYLSHLGMTKDKKGHNVWRII